MMLNEFCVLYTSIFEFRSGISSILNLFLGSVFVSGNKKEQAVSDYEEAMTSQSNGDDIPEYYSSWDDYLEEMLFNIATLSEQIDQAEVDKETPSTRRENQQNPENGFPETWATQLENLSVTTLNPEYLRP